VLGGLVCSAGASLPAFAADFGPERRMEEAQAKQEACYEAADMELDRCMTRAGAGTGAMNICWRAESRTKKQCDEDGAVQF
jgi:hypothetical protein